MSEDRVPTTGEVREGYALRAPSPWHGERRAEFDRWLAAHDAEVTEDLRVAAVDLRRADSLAEALRGEVARLTRATAFNGARCCGGCDAKIEKARAEDAEAKIAAVLLRHRGMHTCGTADWWTDNPAYKGRIARRGECPEVIIIRAALTAEPRP